MKDTIKAFLLLLCYFGVAIFAGRGAYWNHGWPFWACELVALPIIILGCSMAYMFLGKEGK